jgi:UDP-glucose 4-epimerase
VVVLDNRSTGHLDAVSEGVQWVQGRIREAGDALMGDSFDGVLHLAAKSLVEESRRRLDLHWDNNVCGTLALLAAIRDGGMPRMVFSSTAATYGEPGVTPITEDVPAVATNPYGQSKLAVDCMLARTCRAYGLAAASLRYFNPGGAIERHGERHEPETHLIPNLLAVPTGDVPASTSTALTTRHLMAQRSGTTCTSSTWAKRRAALQAVRPGQHYVASLGTGAGYSAQGVLDACREVAGHPIPAVERDRRPGDPLTLVA